METNVVVGIPGDVGTSAGEGIGDVVGTRKFVGTGDGAAVGTEDGDAGGTDDGESVGDAVACGAGTYVVSQKVMSQQQGDTSSIFVLHFQNSHFKTCLKWKYDPGRPHG